MSRWRWWPWRRDTDGAGGDAGARDAGALASLQHQLAITRAVEEERRRIHDDLHDDVGSRLLTLLHRVPASEQALVREILHDLRAIIARDRSAGGTLLEVLAQLRDEAELRLQLRDIALAWQQDDDLPDPPLDAAQALHLFRIGREAVSNALRHAAPSRLRVVVAAVGEEIVFEVTDDGRFDPERIGAGRGTRSMRHRADALQGDIVWQAGTLGGTKVCLRFPLPRAGDPASAGWPSGHARERLSR